MEDGIGRKIKAAREGAGLTQEDLAEHMEASRQAVSKWEADLSRPSSENLLRLCKLLGLDWEELAGETEEIAPPEEEGQEQEIGREKKDANMALLLPFLILGGGLLTLLVLFFFNAGPPRNTIDSAPPPEGVPATPIATVDSFPEAIALTAKEVRDFGSTQNGGEKVPAADVEANRLYVHWFPGPYMELSFYLRQDWANDKPYYVLFAVYTDSPEGGKDYTVITSLAEGPEAETPEFTDFEALGYSGCKVTVQSEFGPFTYYFALDRNGVPELYFVVDGETYEQDIDADGENEIISPDSQYIFYDRGMEDYWAYQIDGELPEGFVLDFTYCQEEDGTIPDTPAFCLQSADGEWKSYRHLFGDKLISGEAACSKNALTDLLCPDVKDTVFTFTYTGEMYDSETDPDLPFENPDCPTHRQLAYMAMQTLYDLTGVKLERCYAHATDYSVYLSTDRRHDFGTFFTFDRDPRWQAYENSVGGFMLIWKGEQAEYSPIDPALFQIPGGTEEEQCLWLYEHARFFQYGEIVDIGWDINTRLFLEDGSFFEVSSNTNGYAELRGPYPEGFSH